MTPSDADILTLPEVAAWLKVRPRQIERLGVPCVRLGRKTVRFLRADVLAWLQAQRGATAKSVPARLHNDRTARGTS